jgi:creatinine amidohydrolase
MRVTEMHWMQVEAYLRHDDRCVVPLGSTEQHAFLSLSVDSILSEHVAAEAAEPLGVPVFPVLAYGLTPYFQAFPGTISLRMETYIHLVRDILDSLYRSGFRRILLCNGHGGNAPAGNLATEWMADHPDARVRFHSWWMENFPWTRLANIRGPETQKPMADLDRLRLLDPAGVRAMLGDGNYGGLYQRPDADMLAIWAIAVAETRALIEGPWA